MNSTASTAPTRDSLTSEQTQYFKYRLGFLVTLLAVFATLGAGFGAYRLHNAELAAALNFSFGAINLLLLLALLHNKDRFQQISTVMILLANVMAIAGYLSTDSNPARISLFMLLLAIIVFLKGRTVALVWLCIMLATIAGGYMLGFQNRYTRFEVVAAGTYLVVFFAIVWLYERLRESQQQMLLHYERQQINDQRLRLALNAASMGVWEIDLRTGKWYWSSRVFRFLGLSHAEPSLAQLIDLLDPEHAARVKDTFNAAVTNREPFYSEFRVGVDPVKRWVEVYGELQIDDAGTPVRMVGTARDVTDRKFAQAELVRARRARDDEYALFQTILDNAPLGIWMLDVDSRLRFVNRTFSAAVGVSEKQFVAARHYADVLPSAVAASCIQSDRACLAQAGPHRSTERIPFVDGRDHVLEITKVRVLDRDGTVRGLIGLAMDVTERREYESRLEYIAHYDPLTGAPNRVLLADRMAHALERARRKHSPLAICYIDLDGFKRTNDSWGHAVGDHVLVEITKRIKAEIHEDDTVARIGGDEFVVLLASLRTVEDCPGAVARLLDLMQEPMQIGSVSLRTTASIGVTLYPEDDHDPDTMLRHADHAMYLAKQAGKNRFHQFDVEHDRLVRSRDIILDEIRSGLAHDQFSLYFQPKVELRTRRMIGAEALIRWQHPDRGLLLPSEFMRMVANSTLEIELGDWVLKTAFHQLAAWQAVTQSFVLCVNVSAHQLLSPGFAERLRDLQRASGPVTQQHRLEIEVTETAVLEDAVRIGSIIRTCREFGILFALDDFGTGFSSLAHMQNLDVDAVKIDQSFVRDMLEDKGDAAIVQAVIAIAKAFGRASLAEGIETDEQYAALLEMGCDYGQGYCIARPMPAQDVMSGSLHT